MIEEPIDHAITIILDASRSMKTKIDDISLFDREINVLNTIKENSNNVPYALYVYGHNKYAFNISDSCEDIEKIGNYSIGLTENFVYNEIGRKKQKGVSALFNTLQLAMSDISNNNANKNTIIIIGDGEDNCSPEYTEVVNLANTLNEDTKIITFNVSNKDSEIFNLLEYSDRYNYEKLEEFSSTIALTTTPPENPTTNNLEDTPTPNDSNEAGDNEEINLEDTNIGNEESLPIDSLDGEIINDINDETLVSEEEAIEEIEVIEEPKGPTAAEKIAAMVTSLLNNKQFMLYASIGVGAVIFIFIVLIFMAQKHSRDKKKLMATIKDIQYDEKEKAEENEESADAEETPVEEISKEKEIVMPETSAKEINEVSSQEIVNEKSEISSNFEIPNPTNNSNIVHPEEETIIPAAPPKEASGLSNRMMDEINNLNSAPLNSMDDKVIEESIEENINDSEKEK